jgi:hypothetical protein
MPEDGNLAEAGRDGRCYRRCSQHRELFGWSRFLGLAGRVAVLW